MLLRWYARKIHPLLSSLYRLADGYSEQASAIGFVGRWVVANWKWIPGAMFLKPGWREAYIRLRGIRYLVSLDGGEAKSFGTIYHERQCDQVPAFTPSAGWTVFDIGANVGVYAVQQARRGARVFAFEPNPYCCRRLLTTIRDNGLDKKVHVLGCAIGATAGFGALIVSSEGSGVGVMVPADDLTKIQVPGYDVFPGIEIVPLDSAVPSTGVERIDLMKIDVEGAEVDLLSGALRTLEITDRVVLEYHSTALLEQAQALLRKNGFVRILRFVDRIDNGTERGQLYMEKRSLRG